LRIIAAILTAALSWLVLYDQAGGTAARRSDNAALKTLINSAL